MSDIAEALLGPLEQSATAWLGFDAGWYRLAHPDLAGADDAALLAHYRDHAGPDAVSPNMYFDEAWYRARNPDVAAAIAAGRLACGYAHYATIGYATRSGHWLFDDALYAAGSPDLGDAVLTEAGCANRYDHYIKAGAREGRVGHALFEPGAYAAAAGGMERVLAEAHSPFAHYLRAVWTERADRPTGAGFDAGDYLARTPGTAEALRAGRVACALQHHLMAGPAADPVATVAMAGPAALAGAVHFDVDSCTVCPPDGILLVGWLIAPPGAVSGMRLLAGTLAAELDPARFIIVHRPDVRAHLGGGAEMREDCGFVAFVAGTLAAGEKLFLEVTRADGEVMAREAPAPARHGMAAIRDLLGLFDLRHGALAAAFDDVAGPAMERLAASVIAQPLPREAMQFGAAPAEPRLSLVVPLYGRLDFMEYQLALLSRHKGARDYDIIYVLDDPPRRRAAELLADSCFQRFGLPFRLVALGRNAGYAPANNVGIGLARGRIVALVNSDVMPTDADGFDRLADRLEADAGLGAVGPVLLFEDGTVQHQGMAFERLAEFAGWHFPLHVRKGLRPPDDAGLHDQAAITAACMLLPRDLLVELGGFDEGYLIGDFEDADLCLRLVEKGYRVAVDHGVRMHHLERQSQAGSEQRWRMNLTLHNARRHELRWGGRLAP